MDKNAPGHDQTIVTFNSTAFNHTERKPYFINDCCYGDDLAKWISAELAKKGVHTIGEPGQEDFGWYLTFEIEQSKYFFLISYRPDDMTTGATWIGFIERVCSPFARLLGRQKRSISPAAPMAIHQALSGSPQIHEIRWRNEKDTY